MSVNRYLPHLYVIPEDEANRQMANGFLLHPKVVDRKIQILEEAGGWSAVVDRFNKNHVATMRKFPEGRFLLLLDFDDQLDRLDVVRKSIPEDLRERVFVLGVLTEPEALRQKLHKPLEEIGAVLASECTNETYEVWTADLLLHNADELLRLRTAVKPFLFV